MTETHDLSGTWQSTYEYGEGKEGTHEVLLEQHGWRVTGKSLPHETGSQLSLDLRRKPDDQTLTGLWSEVTSPGGAYRGQKFHGALQLILNAEATSAEGQWVGHNRDHDHVNNGVWRLERL